MKINSLTGLPWKRLYRIGKPFWVSDQKWIGLGHLAALLALLYARAHLAKYTSEVAAQFMTAFEKRHEDVFYHELWIYVALLVLAIPPLEVAYAATRTRLALIWRQWLSADMFCGYFTNRTYLWMIRNPSIDNPDQRMTQDPDSFANTSVGLFFAILDSVVNVIIFSIVLWHLSPILTGAVYGYAVLGCVAVLLIGHNMAALNFRQMQTEGDLRFTAAEARREALMIALYRAESLMLSQSKRKLKDVIDTLLSIMWLNVKLQLFTNPYNALVPLIPAALMAPLYFSHSVEWGQITQATIAFGWVFGGATILIGQFGGIANYVAIINRLGGFREAVEEGEIKRLPPGQHIEYVHGDQIAFDNATIMTPDMVKPVIFDLNLVVPPGRSIYITGAEGTGKSAVINTILGVWVTGSGKVTIPSPDQMMYLNAALFVLPTMTLRQVLCYEDVDGKACPDSARLQQVLALVGLSDLSARAGGLDTPQNWKEFVNSSELQRLGLARIIWRKPRYVLLDSLQLEEDNERLLFSVLAGVGTTVLTAGGSTRPVKYHTDVLELLGDGQWKLAPASQYTPRPTGTGGEPNAQHLKAFTTERRK